MRNFLRSTLTLIALSAVVVLFAYAQTRTRGTWTAEVQNGKPDTIHLQIQRAQKESNFGNDFQLSDLKGLDAAALKGSNVPVNFSLDRDAGRITFTGTFNQGLGHGELTFSPSAEYIAAMGQMGYPNVSDKIFELAVIDVSRAYVKELKDLGYSPTFEELISARIFRVDRQQVESLRASGAKDLPIKKLVEYRIFKIDADYIGEMRKSFPNIDLDKMVAMRIHKATPEFAREMAALGYGNLDADKLVEFRIQGVTPEYIREMRELGLKDLTADQLVQFRIFGVGKSQLDDLAKEGYKGLSPDNLVAFRIHHVDSNFIEKVKAAGYSHPSPDELIQFKILGIHTSAKEI